MKRYFIIGAGLSGLRIGQLLASAGKRVDIFEMDDAVGGLMRTEKRNGFLFDIGPHIFFKDHAEEYQNLIGNDFHNIKALYGIGFERKDIISPIRPLNLIKNLGIRRSIPLVWDVLQHKLNRDNEDMTVIDTAEKWVINNFGKEVYRCFFKDYILKVMGLPAPLVSKDWGTERHKFYKEHNLWQKSSKFLLSFLFNKESKGGYLDVYYPEHGAQQIPDAMCEQIKKHGGKVHLRSMAKRIEMRAGKVTALVIKKDDGEEKIEVEDNSVVISTMPITNLFNVLVSVDGDMSSMKNIAETMKYRRLWLFNLTIKKERLQDKAQIYFPESKYIFKRIYEPKNLLNRLAVNRDKTAICVEVCYNEGDDSESMGENKVFSKVMEGLRDFYRISDADVLDMWSKKVPFAYSIYELEYRERLLRLAECLFGIDNFISFGRQGSFRYNHMTNSIMDACNAVYSFLRSGTVKKEFLVSPNPKSDFF